VGLGKLSLGFSALLAMTGTSQAVMLGGTNVTKDKFVVYLMIGHSNMAGQDLAHSDGTSDPHGWYWPVNSTATTKQWTAAKEVPNAGRPAGISGHGEGGPSMPLIKGLIAAYPGYYIGVLNNASLSATCKGINTGSNSSSLDPSDNRYYKGTYLYQQLIDAAKSIQADVTFGGLLCMLGTVDATRTNQQVCEAFSDDVSQLVKDIRTDLGLPNLPFLMGAYENGASGDFALTKPLPAIIDAQIKLIPSKLPISAVVDSKGITMLDDHHYIANAGGQPVWASRAITLIQTNHWFPDGTTALATTLAPMAARSGASIGFAAGELWIKTGAGTWSADGRAPARGAARISDKAAWAPLPDR